MDKSPSILGSVFRPLVFDTPSSPLLNSPRPCRRISLPCRCSPWASPEEWCSAQRRGESASELTRGGCLCGVDNMYLIVFVNVHPLQNRLIHVYIYVVIYVYVIFVCTRMHIYICTYMCIDLSLLCLSLCPSLSVTVSLSTCLYMQFSCVGGCTRSEHRALKRGVGLLP